MCVYAQILLSHDGVSLTLDSETQIQGSFISFNTEHEHQYGYYWSSFKPDVYDQMSFAALTASS